MKLLLDALILIVRISPIIVLGFIIVLSFYFSFISRAFRRRRIPMGASFILGILAITFPVVIHGGNTSDISWFLPTRIAPFSLGGLLTYGIAGLVTGFLLIWIVQWAFGKPQVLVASLVGTCSVLLFYYIFADETASETVSMLAFGVLIGVLSHITLFRDDDEITKSFKKE